MRGFLPQKLLLKAAFTLPNEYPFKVQQLLESGQRCAFGNIGLVQKGTIHRDSYNMLSLWYRTTRAPGNLDDCLDLGEKKPIQSVVVRLGTQQHFRDHRILTQFAAEFEIHFAEETLLVEEICGGYLDNFGNAKKKFIVQRANETLRAHILKFSERGIPILNRDKNFNGPSTLQRKNSDEMNPYQQFAHAELILRDRLAIDRTILANERTFLSYCRTSLALFLTGTGFLKFFDSHISFIAGWSFIVLGFAVSVIGVWRSGNMARDIRTAGSRDGDLKRLKQRLDQQE